MCDEDYGKANAVIIKEMPPALKLVNIYVFFVWEFNKTITDNGKINGIEIEKCMEYFEEKYIKLNGKNLIYTFRDLHFENSSDFEWLFVLCTRYRSNHVNIEYIE